MKKAVLFLTNENTFAVILTITVFFMIYILRAQGLQDVAESKQETPQEILIPSDETSLTYIDVKK